MRLAGGARQGSCWVRMAGGRKTVLGCKCEAAQGPPSVLAVGQARAVLRARAPEKRPRFVRALRKKSIRSANVAKLYIETSG
jgi:hypothetical protein